MKRSNFWESRLDKFLIEIDDYLSTQQEPQYAAFDADGTLWFNDVGREVFLHQCDSVYKGLWTWADYQKREDENVEEGLWWMAEINAGRTPSEVIQDAQDALEKKIDLQLIPSTKKLIEFLKSKKVEVFIVTASVKWAIVPAALRLGVESTHILGVETLTDTKGFITKTRKDILTWTHGKAEAMLEHKKLKHPFLCGGNSISDIHLLNIASKFKMGVRAEDPKERLFQSETKLEKHCKEQGWIHFDYHDETTSS